MHAMKKTMLAAAAALGATAACAADVTVYGLVDYGLMYTGTDNGSNTSHVTEMTSAKIWAPASVLKDRKTSATA